MDEPILNTRKDVEELLENNPNSDSKRLESPTDTPEINSEPDSFHFVSVKTEVEQKLEDESETHVGYSQIASDDMKSDVEKEKEEQVKPKRKRNIVRIKVTCEQCGLVCGDRNRYKLHLMDHTGERPFKCNFCEKAYKKQFDLTNHIASHTGKYEHHCEVCNKGFTVKSALRAHMRTHTKDKPYICPICGMGFSHHASLKPHIAIHSDECPFECDQCDRKFKTRKMLTNHLMSHGLDGNGLQCGICFKFYKSKEGLRLHMKKHRIEDGEEQNRKTHTCGHCGNVYKHLISLRNHMRLHTKELFECHLCDKSYMDKNKLRIHIRDHTGEKPYTCDICDRKFRRRDSFVYHRNTHDSDRKTYKCDLCDKVLACRSSLRTHQARVHSSEKKHECHLCDRKYKMRFELTKHLRRHNGDEEPLKEDELLGEDAESMEKESDTQMCDVCQAECSLEELEGHMMSHDVKPLRCECMQLFYSEVMFNKHMKSGCEAVKKCEELIEETTREARVKEEALHGDLVNGSVKVEPEEQ